VVNTPSRFSNSDALEPAVCRSPYIISTGAMVALGKVRGNLMIDLHTTSAKLRDRAVRVVVDLAKCDYESARRKLEAADWNLRAVVERL
jgi:N-acetylmuramic acid 6-phosphate etherase